MGQKGASAKNVHVEEAAVEAEETREYGTIKVLSLPITFHGNESYSSLLNCVKMPLSYSAGTPTEVSDSLVALWVGTSE